MDSFRALVVDRAGDNLVANIREVPTEHLPEGDVTVAVSHSSLNYKDGLVLNGLGSLVKTYPHVPGIDYTGVVLRSTHTDFAEGDRVIGTGFRVGEVHWGGYAQQVRVRGDWLVPLPPGLSPKRAMAIGSAGLTAAIALRTLESHGLRPERGEVLVTGASGGVGSMAVALLAALGYAVVASTGRSENADYLMHLGASAILPRAQLEKPSGKPLESGRWTACIDSVGGSVLARVLGQVQPAGAVAAIGLAGGATLETSVIPFLLRGISLLGIDSVFYANSGRSAAWKQLAETIPHALIDTIASEATLGELPQLGRHILQGNIRGRVVVDVNR